MAVPAALPETAGVHWRPRMDAQRLRRYEHRWTCSTVGYVVPHLLLAGGLLALEPLFAPLSAIALALAWIVPELYAQRGANVARPRRRLTGRAQPDAAAQRTALGLLGDLVGHEARALHAQTGLVPERGALGVWLIGEQGALLVRPGGRRVDCWCVRVDDPDLPPADRIAHLLLALREDEQGFATVANMAFSGARWRVRRRLGKRHRPALDHTGYLTNARRARRR